uniref:NAD-dependent epimerase/dehydratase domain-containing protein n=1 Tax=Plectus sambesii TaxID=2011161 RepID=A0A914XAV0_9BILA
MEHRKASIDQSENIVLVTGASGYLALHCVRQLLEDGYRVRGTVRSLRNEYKARPIRDLDTDGRLELVEADLEKADDWPKAVAGCTYILHVASPWPIVADESIIKTAVDGTMNVLRAANASPGVKKIVLTSSCSAVNDGYKESGRVFTEEDWTNLENPTVVNYARSKTLAERAAWDYYYNMKDGNRFELTVLNPTLVVGPILSENDTGSLTIIKRFMSLKMPAVPKMQLALVDVRDVAKAHVIAMTSEASNGHRILITAQPSFWFKDIARVLIAEFRHQGYLVSISHEVPYCLVKFLSYFDPHVASIMDRLNFEVKFDNSKAKNLLHMDFTPPEKALVDMIYSMVEKGVLEKHTKNYSGISNNAIIVLVRHYWDKVTCPRNNSTSTK